MIVKLFLHDFTDGEEMMTFIKSHNSVDQDNSIEKMIEKGEMNIIVTPKNKEVLKTFFDNCAIGEMI